MSTNILIKGVRHLQVIKTGDVVSQTELFPVLQTPSDVTYKIVESGDKVQAYRDWVLSISEDVEEPMYATDDIYQVGEPIGTKTYNSGKSHIERLNAWIEMMTLEGYDIEFDTL